MEAQNIWRAWFSRITRGSLLVIWILGLSLVALGSLEGSLADLLLTKGFVPELIGVGGVRYDIPPTLREAVIGEGFFLKDPGTVRRCPSGDQILAQSRVFEGSPPPVDAILDALVPKWATAKNTETNQCTRDEAATIRQAYRYLFSKVGERLRAVARDTGADPKGIVIDGSALPPDFRNLVAPNASTEIKLPPEVQDWVLRERVRLKQEAQARALVGTFLLLAVLGALGSLIFLIRDYITADEEKTLADYIFRPVLGVFLAVAIFIVDLMAHSIISTASVLEVRYEPLYILALGAGLLSERAYNLLRGRADSALADYQKGEDKGGGGAPSEVPPNKPLQPTDSASG